jgi:alpha,alpha-trehalose phosphorylase
MAIVYGFGGYRWRSRGPEFSPILPTRASRLRIQLLLRGSALSVDIEQHRVTYQVKSGDPVTAHHYGQAFTVSSASPVSFSGEYRTFDAPPFKSERGITAP